MASFEMFSRTVFKIKKSATDVFAQKKFSKDIHVCNSEICYRYDKLVIGPHVVQFKDWSNSAHNFKSLIRF